MKDSPQPQEPFEFGFVNTNSVLHRQSGSVRMGNHRSLSPLATGISIAMHRMTPFYCKARMPHARYVASAMGRSRTQRWHAGAVYHPTRAALTWRLIKTSSNTLQ